MCGPKTSGITDRRTMPKRRPNRDGSIYRRKDGRWVASLSIRGDRRSVYRGSRELARLALAELRAEALTPPKPSTVLTVGEYLSSWLKVDVTPNQAPGTLDSYQRAVENHISPHVGLVPLRDLTSDTIKEWVAERLEVGDGARTVQNAYAVLRAALQCAVDSRKILKTNPAGDVKRPKHERKEIEPFTIPEAKAIVAAAAMKRLGGVTILGITVGMRLSEILGIPWRDVDLAAGQVRVRQQANEIKGKVLIRALKTSAARRTLDLPPAAITALHLRKIDALKEGNAGCDLVFSQRNGQPMGRNNYSARHWNPLIRKLKFRHRGFHHTRHTAATTALTNGVSILEVSRMLGHSRVSTTVDIYGHWVQSGTAGAAEAIGRLYGG